MTLPTDDWRNTDTRSLFEAITSLADIDSAAAFFRDLCTRRELEEMSHRWAIVRLLDEGLFEAGRAGLLVQLFRTAGRQNPSLVHGDQPVEVFGLIHIG